ncbi:uncharacterized protein LOC119602888 [Lucilia sericata]|uniref:uncharacterized protein LOC119602888 n=1 Tax=Lucilia sericata TaxID=13632 RepID=UPI0018A7EB72|nr:uncharacterized protein LOC119602888 [Lucilia sericata]
MDFLLQLLNITLLSMEATWQLQELNDIINAAGNSTEILTLAIFGQSQDIEPYIRVAETNNIPKLVMTRNYGDISFNYETGFNRKIFFIAVAALEHKAWWNHLNTAFLGRQGYVKGVFITKLPRRRNPRLDLREHFEWCWRKGFTNALILVDNEKYYQLEYEIFNYNLFDGQKITNMTEFNKLELYPDKFRNLHKYKIRTLAQFDPPRVFEKRECVGKHKKHFLGYVATLFQAFLKEYNAEMDLMYFNMNKSYNIFDLIQRVENDEADLAINPYIPYKGVHLSYPLRMLQRCVVVPFPKEQSKYKFFIMPFESKVWFSFLATWFILSWAKLFGWFVKHKRSAHRSSAALDVTEIFLNVWRLMMYLPSFTSCCYVHFKWFNALWFSLIVVMGFIFSNLYMASLTSFFSGLTFKPTIDTLAQLIQRRIIVDVVDYEIPTILANRDLPKALSELLHARNASELMDDILALNTHHSYADLADRIQFSLNQQIHLRRPVSQIVKECLTTMPFGFLMPAHSQYERPLNRFILRSNAAGLIDKWFLEAIQDGYCSRILTMRMPTLKIARPLTLEHFQFGWFVLAGGYVVGVVLSRNNFDLLVYTG